MIDFPKKKTLSALESVASSVGGGGDVTSVCWPASDSVQIASLQCFRISSKSSNLLTSGRHRHQLMMRHLWTSLLFVSL